MNESFKTDCKHEHYSTESPGGASDAFGPLVVAARAALTASFSCCIADCFEIPCCKEGRVRILLDPFTALDTKGLVFNFQSFVFGL